MNKNKIEYNLHVLLLKTNLVIEIISILYPEIPCASSISLNNSFVRKNSCTTYRILNPVSPVSEYEQTISNNTGYDDVFYTLSLINDIRNYSKLKLKQLILKRIIKDSSANNALFVTQVSELDKKISQTNIVKLKKISKCLNHKFKIYQQCLYNDKKIVFDSNYEKYFIQDK